MDNNLLKIEVNILKQRYWNGEYGIYEVDLLNAKEIYGEMVGSYTTTIVGNFEKKFHEDEEYIMYGEKVVHDRFGEQFKIQFVKTKFESNDRVKAFLNQFCSKNIVSQIMNKYGNEVIQKIVNEEFDYSDIKGMKHTRYESLRKKVVENEYMSELIVGLGEYGITPNQMKRIVNQFGSLAVKKIKDNPYVLCQVHGIGFLKADEIAKRMGYDLESPFRIEEAIKYCLEQNQQSGNSWMYESLLVQNCVDLLGIMENLIIEQLYKMQSIYLDEKKRAALKSTYNTELYVSNKLKEMVNESVELDVDIVRFLEDAQREMEIELTEEQKQLFHIFKKNRVNFLVGYAGCGKSFIQKMVLNLVDKLDMKCLLLAPTGKAAKVAEQYTGRKASTIHRALGIFGGDKNSEVKEIHEDVVVVDEASMIDLFLAQKLLKAIVHKETRLIIIGDDYQIPSVSVGNFLHNCIESGVFPTAKLTKVFRQSEGGILDIATKTRMKEKFIDDSFMGAQQYGVDTMLYSVPQHQMEAAYKKCLSNVLRDYTVDNVLILSPTKKGLLGTQLINKNVQQIANPQSGDKSEFKYGDIVYREKDRVINIRNNYNAVNDEEEQTVVYNGDIGEVKKVDGDKKHIVVDYTFDDIRTDFNMLETLVHSYALTIHKSQGSGFPVVILIMDKAHKWQLNANLLYTGITRAKEKLYIICQADVINAAMKKNENQKRNTFLYEMLIGSAS